LDAFDSSSIWYDVLSAGVGTGAPMEVEVPYSWGDSAFWRLRVNP
jgi:hypothetical protein